MIESGFQRDKPLLWLAPASQQSFPLLQFIWKHNTKLSINGVRMALFFLTLEHDNVSWIFSGKKQSKRGVFIEGQMDGEGTIRLRISNPQIHGLWTPGEEIAFTARPKIHSHSQFFRYGQSIFCLPYRPKFSDFFDLCLHWVSVVRDSKDFKIQNW